jgi:hypothetical protein
MGWRVSLYKADKNEPVKIEYSEGEKYPEVNINGEQIIYDCATDVWCYLKQNSEEFNKEIVNLYDNPDCDYYTISKAGFKMLVLEFRRRIINYLEKVMYIHEHPDEKDSIEYWRTDDLEDYVKGELIYWKSEWDGYDGEKEYSELNFKNPYLVSGSWRYRNAIFDMVHIYKVFDWENYSMVVFGG